MSQIEKLFKKFQSKPKSLKYKELVKVLLYLGFEKIEAKGSHVKFKHHKLRNDIIVPVHNGECKGFYKEQVLKQVQSLMHK